MKEFLHLLRQLRLDVFHPHRKCLPTWRPLHIFIPDTHPYVQAGDQPLPFWWHLLTFRDGRYIEKEEYLFEDIRKSLQLADDIHLLFVMTWLVYCEYNKTNIIKPAFYMDDSTRRRTINNINHVMGEQLTTNNVVNMSFCGSRPVMSKLRPAMNGKKMFYFTISLQN